MVDNLIFQAKDIVYMSIESIDVNYAVKGNTVFPRIMSFYHFHRTLFQNWLIIISDSFIDSGISKFNGEVSGEKKLEPWEGAMGNGEEIDLESTENSQVNIVGIIL